MLLRLFRTALDRIRLCSGDDALRLQTVHQVRYAIEELTVILRASTLIDLAGDRRAVR